MLDPCLNSKLQANSIISVEQCSLANECYLPDIVQDAGIAKTLAFNRDIRTRCITLDGDDFNPGGTLTGLLSLPSFMH